MSIDKLIKQTAEYKAAKAAGGFSICVSDQCPKGCLILVPTKGKPVQMAINDEDTDEFAHFVADFIHQLTDREMQKISTVVVNEADYEAVTAALNRGNGLVVKLPAKHN